MVPVMELKWLEDFLTLVDTGNFSRSAELRFTTQPAFSRRIKALEEWVGATLFERAAQPVKLTEAGKQFRVSAEEVVRRLYQSREEVRFATANAAGAVKFAATHSLSLTFFPKWFAAIEARCGVGNIRLDTGHAGICVQMLLHGDCHFLLCHTHPAVEIGLDSRQFSACRVGTDRLIPVCRPDADGRPLDVLDEAATQPCRYLAYAETSAIGRALEHRLRHTETRVRLETVFVSHLAGVLKSMVADGRGMAWLPASHVAEELAAGRFIRAGPERWDLDVEITLYRPRDPLPGPAEALWRVAEQVGTMP